MNHRRKRYRKGNKLWKRRENGREENNIREVI